MICVANDVRVITRDVQTWDDGNQSYRLQLANSDGRILTALTESEIYNTVEPFSVVYDMDIDVYTNGYRTYAEVIAVHPQ